jgi:hypothetical protein
MISLRAKDMATFLNRIYLGKTLSECVLQTTPEAMHVIAVDISNSLVIVVAAPFPQTLNVGPIGIGDLQFLINVLNKFGDSTVDMDVTDNRLSIRGAGNTIKILLANAEAIGTMPDEVGNLANIKNRCCYSVKLDEANRSSLTTNIKLFDKATVTVGIVDNNGRGTCVITAGNDTENQYNIQFGRVTISEGSVLRPVTFEVDAKHMKEVLDATGSGTETPNMLLSDDPLYPVVIAQDLDVWGLQPTAAGRGGA